MSKRVRALSSVLAATAAAAAAALSAAPAQATTSGPVYLYTASSLASCTATGNNGVAGGVFAGFTCRSGFAGYSLSVQPTPGHTGGAYVSLATLTLTTCTSAGRNGVGGGVFTGFYCQNGFAGYSLMVKD